MQRRRAQSLPNYSSLPKTDRFIPADLMTCNNHLLEEGLLPSTIVIPLFPKAIRDGMLTRRNSSHLFYNLNIERPVALDGSERVILSDIKEQDHQKSHHDHHQSTSPRRQLEMNNTDSENHSSSHQHQHQNHFRQMEQTKQSQHYHHRLSKRPREADVASIGSQSLSTFDESILFSECYKDEIRPRQPS